MRMDKALRRGRVLAYILFNIEEAEKKSKWWNTIGG